MPPKSKPNPATMEPAHPEYVNGYQVGHQDGHTVGFAEGRAAGLKEAGDADTVAVEAERRGYEAGYQAAMESKRPPLFEAAKRIVEERFDQPDEALDSAFAELEAKYGETISHSDRALLAAMAHRARVAAEAQRQALLRVNRPKSQLGRAVAKRISGEEAQRAETVYETVS